MLNHFIRNLPIVLVSHLLIWQISAETLAPTPATGPDSKDGKPWPKPRFEAYTKDCLRDKLTGLIWSKNANLFGQQNWQDALNLIEAMNTTPGKTGYNLCGSKGWSLPSVNQLRSLVNYSVLDGAAWLNSQGFVNVQQAAYNTSNTTVDNGYRTLNISFGNSSDSNGSVLNSDKFKSNSVWPVLVSD